MFGCNLLNNISQSFQFDQIAASNSCNTSSQAILRLQIVAVKRRIHLQPNNLEVLYLLASFKDQVEPCDPEKYEKAIKQLVK